MFGFSIFFLLFLISGVPAEIGLRGGAPHATNTKIGLTYRGTVANSRENRPYYAFLGIRYAKPPIRFRPPVPLSGAEDYLQTKNVQDATKFGARCPQKFWATQEVLGDEDCLFLNIFVPSGAGVSTEPRPVMFYIHGGRFTDGEGESYGPDYFMDEDVVLVTINYRLGVLGFLTTGDSEVPGNMGLRDQALALKWVHDNIRAFNGDPKRVTIFGESAGAASVHFQMFWPPNKGLFSGAIAQSGTATCGWAVQNFMEAIDHSAKLGKLVGCGRTGERTSKEFIECLQSKDWKDLIINQSNLGKWLKDRTIPFGPVVEHADHDNPIPFLGETPESLIQEGQYIKVPFITGIAEDEGHQIQSAFVLKNPDLTAELNNNWEKRAPETFLYGTWLRNQNDSAAVSARVRQFYFGDSPVSVDTRAELTDLYSDVIFVHGTKKTAEMMATSTPTYLYLFTYKGEFSCTSLMGIKEYLGVTHADDLQYFFFTKKYGPKEGLPKNSESEKISKNLIKLWVSFARTGRPDHVWGNGGSWLPTKKMYGKSTMKNWYILDKNPKLKDNLFEERIKFWDEMSEQYFIKKELLKNRIGGREKIRTEL